MPLPKPKPKLREFLFALAVLTTLYGFKSFLSIFLNTVCSLDLFSYKWLSLPLAAAILFRDRSLLAAAASRPAVGGLVALVAFGILGFVGKHGQQFRFELIALVGQPLALAWAFYGKRVALRLLFPALAAVTVFPVEAFLDFGRSPEATSAFPAVILPFAAAVLNCCGVETILNGLDLQIPSAGLTVNGLAFECRVVAMFSSFLLVLAIASWRLVSVKRRLAAVAIALPLAVFANAIHLVAFLFARLSGASSLALHLMGDRGATCVVLALVGGIAVCAVHALAKGDTPCVRS